MTIMKLIRFLAIICAILVTIHEINAAKTRPRLDERKFIDEDFTDYQDYPPRKTKRETNFTDKSSVEKSNLLKSLFRRQNFEKSTRPKREVSFLDPVSPDSLLKKINNLNTIKEKQFLRSKREAISSASSAEQDINSRAKSNQEDSAPNIVPESEKDLRLILGAKIKLNKEEKKSKIYAARVKQRHDNKVKEIMEFLKENHMSTQYVYNEIKRIQSYGEVVDKLRRLVIYLEQPRNKKLKESVLNCFYKNRQKEVTPVDIWKDRKTNKLIIDDIKDPYDK